MAPCRDSSVKVSQLYSTYCNMSPLPTSADMKSNNEQSMATTASVRCCYPDGECLKMDAIITADQLIDCVRVICNNENCVAGEFMHRQCFDAWEQGILVKAVGGNGRAARQWSERQRNQNLWSKKGFELVHKVCQCKCGSGHIRKDLDWISSNNNGTTMTKNGHIANGQQLQSQQQRFVNGFGIAEDEDKKKRKKRNRNANQQQQQQQQKLPLSVLSSNNVSNVQQQNLQMQQQQQMNSKQINDVSGDNLTTNHANVGVIGSGLHQHNNNGNNQLNPQQQQQQRQQQQEQIITSTLNNLLNSNNSLNTASNNILGLDLRTRASSLSSGAEGGSGTTSPSTSNASGELSVWKPMQQQQQLHHIPLLTQPYIPPETVSLSPQQLQQQQIQQHNCLLQQQHQAMNGLSKSILNGITSNVNTTAPLLMKSQIDQQKQQQQQQQQQQAIIKQQLSVYDQQHLMQRQKNKEVELYSERVR